MRKRVGKALLNDLNVSIGTGNDDPEMDDLSPILPLSARIIIVLKLSNQEAANIESILPIRPPERFSVLANGNVIDNEGTNFDSTDRFLVFWYDPSS
jgi:hypothetical protein